MTEHRPEGRFSVAEKIGAAALLLALLLSFFQVQLAVISLLLFVLLCLGAPFFPQLPFFLPTICRGRPGSVGVALTFDDGPSPDSTPLLLELLARYRLTATFFVVGEKAARHPALIAEILAHGHSIGNHSFQHDYLLMLRTPDHLEQDIRSTQEVLRRANIVPRVFRPPIGITGPRLKKALDRLGMRAVTYSCQAFDRGNRIVDGLAKKITRCLQPGDIIMLHDILPESRVAAKLWQSELNRLFSDLHKTTSIVPLDQLTGFSTMDTGIACRNPTGEKTASVAPTPRQQA